MISLTLRGIAPLLSALLMLLLATPALAELQSQPGAGADQADPPAGQRARLDSSSRGNETHCAATGIGSGDCDDTRAPVHPDRMQTVATPPPAATGNRASAAQDYNSSRSNKAGGEAHAPVEDEPAPTGVPTRERPRR